jgi:hypothetical protein
MCAELYRLAGCMNKNWYPSAALASYYADGWRAIQPLSINLHMIEGGNGPLRSSEEVEARAVAVQEGEATMQDFGVHGQWAFTRGVRTTPGQEHMTFVDSGILGWYHIIAGIIKNVVEQVKKSMGPETGPQRTALKRRILSTVVARGEHVYAQWPKFGFSKLMSAYEWTKFDMLWQLDGLVDPMDYLMLQFLWYFVVNISREPCLVEHLEIARLARINFQLLFEIRYPWKKAVKSNNTKLFDIEEQVKRGMSFRSSNELAGDAEMREILVPERRLNQNGGGMRGACNEYWHKMLMLHVRMVSGTETQIGWSKPVHVSSNSEVELNGRMELQDAVGVCGASGEGDCRVRLEQAARLFPGVSDADAAELLGVGQVTTYQQLRLKYMRSGASFAVASADAVFQARTVHGGGDRAMCGRNGGLLVTRQKGTNKILSVLMLTEIFTVSYDDEARVYAFACGVPLFPTKPVNCATSPGNQVHYYRLPVPPEARKAVLPLTKDRSFEGASVSHCIGVPGLKSPSKAVVEDSGVFIIAPRSSYPPEPEALAAAMLKWQDKLVPLAKVKAEEVMLEQERVRNLDIADMAPKKRTAAINQLTKGSGELQKRLIRLELMDEDEDILLGVMRKLLIAYYESEDGLAEVQVRAELLADAKTRASARKPKHKAKAQKAPGKKAKKQRK